MSQVIEQAIALAGNVLGLAISELAIHRQFMQQLFIVHDIFYISFVRFPRKWKKHP